MNSCPIDLLPDELVILMFITITQIYDFARPAPRLIDYSLTLSHVCSRWRRLAINSPSLWTRLDLTSIRKSPKGLERARTYSQRAKNCLLDIRFGTFTVPWLPINLEEDLKVLLTSLAPRSRHMAINYVDSQFVRDTIHTLIFGGAPITSMALLCSTGDKDVLSKHDPLTQEHLNWLFNSLKHLHLYSVSLNWDSFSSRNLVTLQLIALPRDGAPSPDQLVAILAANPGLRGLQLTQIFHHFIAPDSASQSIQLPDLERLNLNMDIEAVNWLINLLIPGSVNLALHVWSRGEASQVDIANSIIKFARRARITEFYVSGMWMPISRMFGHLPHLKILGLAKQLLEASAFAGIEELAYLLPSLHTLRFRSCMEDGGIHVEALRPLVAIRSLRAIGLRDCGFFEGGKRVDSHQALDWIQKELSNDNIYVHLDLNC